MVRLLVSSFWATEGKAQSAVMSSEIIFSIFYGLNFKMIMDYSIVFFLMTMRKPTVGDLALVSKPWREEMVTSVLGEL